MFNKTICFRFWKSNIFLFIGLLLSALVLWPLAKPGYFTHHDDLQLIRLYEMDKCFKDFQVPCRWVPDLGLGYGYPLFNYYAPLPYYFGEVVYLVSGNLLTSAKIMFGFAFLFSYITMYLLGSKLWGKLGGSVSAILYSLAPYHAANLYVRGAMGELWAMAIMPLVLFFLLRLKEKVNLKNSVCLGTATALLITSHNLSAMLFLPMILLIAAVLYQKNRNSGFLKHLFLSLILSLMISAFYWLPAITEGKYVHLESMTVGYFSYTEHFKGLRKLFSLGWDWRPSLREFPGSEPDGNWFTIGWVHIGVLTISTLGFLISKKIRKSKYSSLVLCCLFLVAISIFLIHPRSLFIWQVFHAILKYLQFPWRFLIFVSFFISLISGVLIKLVNNKQKSVLFIIIVVLAFLFNFRYFKPERFLGVTEKDYLQGEYWDKQITRSIFDYTPIYAKLPPPGEAPDLPEVLEGEVEILQYNKGGNYQISKVNVYENSVLRLPLFDFPGMIVEIDNKKVDHWNDDCRNQQYCLGLISFTIPSGEHKIEARMENTPVRTFGNTISLLSGILIAGLLIYRKVNKKYE